MATTQASTAAAALKISRFPSPVLMADVPGSGKKRHKYHEGVGRWLSFVSMGPVGEEGRHSGRERGTKVFPCMRWTASLPAGKRKSGLPSQKSRPLFHVLGAQGAGRRTDSSGLFRRLCRFAPVAVLFIGEQFPGLFRETAAEDLEIGLAFLIMIAHGIQSHRTQMNVGLAVGSAAGIDQHALDQHMR